MEQNILDNFLLRNCPLSIHIRDLDKPVYIVTMFVHGDTTRVLQVYIHRSIHAENNANYCIYGWTAKYRML